MLCGVGGGLSWCRSPKFNSGPRWAILPHSPQPPSCLTAHPSKVTSFPTAFAPTCWLYNPFPPGVSFLLKPLGVRLEISQWNIPHWLNKTCYNSAFFFFINLDDFRKLGSLCRWWVITQFNPAPPPSHPRPAATSDSLCDLWFEVEADYMIINLWHDLCQILEKK